MAGHKLKPYYVRTEGDIPPNAKPGSIYYVDEGPLQIVIRSDGSRSVFAGSGGNPNDKGTYLSLDELKEAIPVGAAGNSAQVMNETENQKYVWDVVAGDWVASGRSGEYLESINGKTGKNPTLGASDVGAYSKEQVDDLLEEINEELSKVAEESEQASEKDKPGGYAGLGETGKVSSDVLPQATENAPGGVVLAKNDDVDAEEDDAKAMTPAKSARMVERKVQKLVSSDVYLATGLTVVKAYDNDPTFDLAGPLSAIEGKIAVDDKVKIAGKVAKITAIEEQTDAPEGETPKVYVTLDKAVLSAADAGAGIGLGVALIKIPDSYPVGGFAWHCGKTPPDGYLACDGSAIPRAVYPELFAVIGTTFGVGNGSTTFNLPDLRDEFVRGASSVRPVGLKEGDTATRQIRLTYTPGTGIKDVDSIALTVTGAPMSDTTDNTLVASVASFAMYVKKAWNKTPFPDRLQIFNDKSGKIGTENRPRNISLLPCIKY